MKTFLVLGACLALAACGSPDPDPDPAATADDPETSVDATAAAHANDTPAPTPITERPPRTAVIAQELAYGSSDTDNLIGYLAMPEDVIEPLPGVIVIHEWWGLNDNIEAVTRQLAGEGYVALAVDLYGGATAETPAEAEALMVDVMSNREAVLGNIRQAFDYLRQFALAPSIGTLGWCLGGGWSLEAGLDMNAELDAVVMYYGQVVLNEAELERLRAPLLGLFAELDETIRLRDVQMFRNRLRDLNKEAEVFIYSDAAHAFANPSGGAYDAESAEDAWSRTIAFLDANLKTPNAAATEEGSAEED